MKKVYSILATTLVIASSTGGVFADNNEDVSNKNLETKTVIEVNKDIKTGTAFINANGVKMRSGPGTSYSVLKTLNKGTMVHTTGQVRFANGQYWKSMTYKGLNGWVSMNYLD